MISETQLPCVPLGKLASNEEARHAGFYGTVKASVFLHERLGERHAICDVELGHKFVDLVVLEMLSRDVALEDRLLGQMWLSEICIETSQGDWDDVVGRCQLFDAVLVYVCLEFVYRSETG